METIAGVCLPDEKGLYKTRIGKIAWALSNLAGGS